jgi:hypothetical protein
MIFWVLLAIFGFFGALRYSAFFFGLFTTGIFLIIYELRRKPTRTVKTRPQTTIYKHITPTTNNCLNCGMALKPEVGFCPRCGKKVIKE